jgi:hypothetical protein
MVSHGALGLGAKKLEIGGVVKKSTDLKMVRNGFAPTNGSSKSHTGFTNWCSK